MAREVCVHLLAVGAIPLTSTVVCAIERTIESEDQAHITAVIPIAGVLSDWYGSDGNLDPKPTRLKTADSNADAVREGLRLELHGGVYGDDKRRQRAIVELLCDKERTGLEDSASNGDYEVLDEKKEVQGPSLVFEGYQSHQEGTKEDTLRLKWYTKYACEDIGGRDENAPSSHWGFFTWMLIM